MADIYNRLLQTPEVTLVVGELKEELKIKTGMLALHSEHFGRIMNKASAQAGYEGRFQLENVGATAVKEFVRWCYLRRLEFLPTANLDELRQRKVLLIDLTIFSDMYGIPKLQNEATAALVKLFAFEPSLLTKDDITIVFKRIPGANPLRELVALILVVQLEAEDPMTNIAAYKDLAQAYEGFTPVVYKWLTIWLRYSLQYSEPEPVKGKGSKVKKVKKPSTLSTLLQQGEIKRMLEVKEMQPADWILEMVGCKPKPVPFQPGEVIEIDCESD